MSATNLSYFIAVAGNVGVGKSSLTERLAHALAWEPFMEPHADNPYLADFYEDMPRWGFHSQVYFLSHRLQHHRRLVDFPGSVVQDRTVYEDAEVFAANLYQQGRLSERDFTTYSALYKGICAFLPPPDLVIYLRASVGILAERISRRGRDYEKRISISYLNRLNQLYEQWAAGWTQSPLMTLEADTLDFVHRPADLAQIIDKVRAALKLPLLAH